MGRANPRALGGKKLFGPIRAPAAVCSQHLIQAGSSAAFPGTSGVAAPMVGWFGTNNGVPGAGFCGSTISGQGAFDLGGTYGYADIPSALRVPTAAPSFMVYTPNVFAAGAFTSVTLNGRTFLSAAADYFDNGGGCGPTYWIWVNHLAGLTGGQRYCVQWVVGV